MRLALPLLAVLLITAVACTPAEPPPEGPPNVLFLFSDDQRPDAIGAYGNPDVMTPSLDSLAAIGFNFREAHIMGAHHGAVCAPSRAMLMSGRSLFRVYDNLDTVRTMPQWFREQGYVTFGTGKWHQSRSSFERSFTEGQHIFFGGMGDHDATTMQDLMPDRSYTAPDSLGFSTTRFADAAVAFLERQASREAPFFAYVSFTAPHDPRTPPPGYAERYEAAALTLPPNVAPVHPFAHIPNTDIRDEVLGAWPRTPELLQEQYAEYYGLITHMDEQSGRILHTLRAQGLAENTIVVFASDHGLGMGSHGLLGKQNLYEHSMGMPLIIAGPKVTAGESDALVYLYDLFPTLAQLTTRQTVYIDTDGVDLSGLMAGAQDTVRTWLFTAYTDQIRAIRDARWKLIRYPELHHTQLFDLQNDPGERNDLAAEAMHQDRVTNMMERLGQWQAHFGDPHPLTSPQPRPMEVDYSQVQRTPDRHQPQWVIDKYFQP
ncbi:MAG: sulfatase-like hydrolase/transferase [Bacteroidota bacterium]